MCSYPGPTSNLSIFGRLLHDLKRAVSALVDRDVAEVDAAAEASGRQPQPSPEPRVSPLAESPAPQPRPSPFAAGPAPAGKLQTQARPVLQLVGKERPTVRAVSCIVR